MDTSRYTTASFIFIETIFAENFVGCIRFVQPVHIDLIQIGVLDPDLQNLEDLVNFGRVCNCFARVAKFIIFIILSNPLNLQSLCVTSPQTKATSTNFEFFVLTGRPDASKLQLSFGANSTFWIPLATSIEIGSWMRSDQLLDSSSTVIGQDTCPTGAVYHYTILSPFW